MRVDRRAEARRYAAPVLLILIATVVALLVRSTLRDDRPRSGSKPARTAPRVAVKPAVARFYVIGTGDTLAVVAERYGTTVDRLLALNPAVEPTTLRVGQRIRVPAPRR